MSLSESEDLTHKMERARHPAGVIPYWNRLTNIWQAVKAKAGLLIPLASIVALAAGVGLGAISDTVSNAVNKMASAFIDGYAIFAPLIIFLVLAPVLSRIFSSREKGLFGLYTVGWISLAKLIAALWAVLFTALIFSFPLLPEGSTSIGQALGTTLSTLATTMTQSPYFWAIYASIAAGIVALKVKGLANILEKGVVGIENVGQYFQPFIPLFLLAVGVYIQSLPANLAGQIDLGGTQANLQTISILGLQIDTSTTTGMVTAYVVGSALIAVAVFAFHIGVLLWTKYKIKGFSIRDYFKHYWLRAYPLLWATSSESLATPLHLYLIKKTAPQVRPTVRRLVGGAAANLCTQGTLICVFVLLGLVVSILGIHLSLFELLLVIPVAFFISFGIPGIPGELLLFAGPIALILAVSPEMLPIFLALYLGLQLGLPDSFRTGGNMTDSYLFTLILNRVYKEKFMAEEQQSEA